MRDSCECDWNYTCGYCLDNAKPWHYTLSDGSAIIVPRNWTFLGDPDFLRKDLTPT